MCFFSFAKPAGFGPSRCPRSMLTRIACLCILVSVQCDEPRSLRGNFGDPRNLKGCFTPDMRVTMADGSHKRISAIRVGETVRSWDSGHMTNATVLDVVNFNRSEIAEIVLDNGYHVRTTPDHPIWSHRLKRIASLDPTETKVSHGLDAGLLAAQDVFEDEHGGPVAGAVTMLHGSQTKQGVQVVNLLLSGPHWFYVEGIRVHNKGGRGGGGRGRSSKGRRRGRGIFGGGGGGTFLLIFFLIWAGSCVLAIFTLFFWNLKQRFCLNPHMRLRHTWNKHAWESGREHNPDVGGLFDGQWIGSYVEHDQRKVASYTLTFLPSGELSGDGEDQDGRFRVVGKYNLNTCEIGWFELYSWGSVDVFGKLARPNENEEGLFEFDGIFEACTGINGTIALKYQMSQESFDGLTQVVGVPIASDAGLSGISQGQPAPPNLQTHPCFSRHVQRSRAPRAVNSADHHNDVVNGQPQRDDVAVGEPPRLPDGWTAHNNYATGDTYYYKASLHTTSWLPPSDCEPDPTCEQSQTCLRQSDRQSACSNQATAMRGQSQTDLRHSIQSYQASVPSERRGQSQTSLRQPIQSNQPCVVHERSQAGSRPSASSNQDVVRKDQSQTSLHQSTCQFVATGEPSHSGLQQSTCTSHDRVMCAQSQIGSHQPTQINRPSMMHERSQDGSRPSTTSSQDVKTAEMSQADSCQSPTTVTSQTRNKRALKSPKSPTNKNRPGAVSMAGAKSRLSLLTGIAKTKKKTKTSASAAGKSEPVPVSV